jgi:hypothetical protein
MKKQFTYLLAILFISFIPLSSIADSIEVTGLVSGNWNADTVNVMGNIELRQAESLNIDQGVKVLFNGQYFFKVTGSLKAIGTAENPIVFSINDTSGFHNDTLPLGGWNQIRIENTDPSLDSIIFDYCHFEYAKAVSNDSIYNYGGALCIRNTDKIAIRNCNFINNYAFISGGAVYLENASILVSNNSFENNRCGQIVDYYGYGGGLCSDRGEAQISHNYFKNNSSTGVGGGLCVRFSDGPVFHNIMEQNFSSLGGGFGILHIEKCNFVISNNLIFNNSSLYFGAGISNNDCSPTYVNNTIVNNHGIGGGGGFYCKDSVVPVLYNNIIYGNTQYNGAVNQIYLWDNLSQPDFYFNDIQGGIESFDGTGGSDFVGKYRNNLDSDPMFEENSFTPALLSPCVNTGSLDISSLMIPNFDLSGNTRIIADTIDIGAFEQQSALGVFSNSKEIPNIKIFPNPAVEMVNIEFELTEYQYVKLYITDINGKLIEEIENTNMPVGKHIVKWNSKPQKSALYFINLQTKTGIKSERIFIKRN